MRKARVKTNYETRYPAHLDVYDAFEDENGILKLSQWTRYERTTTI